jgi:hypothetical protein
MIAAPSLLFVRGRTLCVRVFTRPASFLLFSGDGGGIPIDPALASINDSCMGSRGAQRVGSGAVYIECNRAWIGQIRSYLFLFYFFQIGAGNHSYPCILATPEESRRDCCTKQGPELRFQSLLLRRTWRSILTSVFPAM